MVIWGWLFIGNTREGGDQKEISWVLSVKELGNVGVCLCDCTYSHLEASQKLDIFWGKFHSVHGYSELTVYLEH